LASGFGGIALLLASVGIYGILAYAVARRRREIGVRLALGAQRGAVVRSVLYEGLVLVAAGMAVGVPLSLAAGNLLRSFLYGVTGSDVLTLVGAATTLAIVALLAAYVPARRASNIDPVIALRYE
jgi:ABC-type antimicrobial peptide transport system permease subunit